ncbi:YdiK family protein [Pontibacillus litoralis]|uniref:DUF4305 domain-containing protein n=1 Tax=Pontibacillus litoralis JSM 072002 TaxID=1385512 RepID=A0A0A5HN79_9BACI|nr:YdiK family protein [Pontibacillus litoralis]KGX85067.1 hypothetical protein N784_11265 [Pontibacillus litoralis JSM 072002]
MRTSPLAMAILYFIIGVIFTFSAVGSVEDTVWNFITILLVSVATIDFVVSIRFFTLHFRIKNKQKK